MLFCSFPAWRLRIDEVEGDVALVYELADDRGGEHGLDCEVEVRISRKLPSILKRIRQCVSCASM